MNHSVLYIPSVFRSSRKSDGAPKDELNLVRADFLWPALFMLCLTLTGLHIYPAILGCLAIMLKALREDRNDFTIMLLFLLGGYGLMPQDVFPVKLYDLGVLASIALAVLLRKPAPVKRALVLYLLYVVVMFWIARQSWESMRTQFIVLRGYYSFIILFAFLGCYANHNFDLKALVRRLMVFLVIVCILYVIDGLILKSHVFLPDAAWGYSVTIGDLSIHPFSLMPERIYPAALLFIPLAIVPAMRLFRIPRRIWALIIVSALITQTFTYLTALTVTILLFQGSMRRLLKITLATVIAAVVFYSVDCFLPVTQHENGSKSSTLRIKSTLDQFVDLADAMDDEDIAEFGSGRMAQAIPKLELVELYHKEWTGLGFLHQDYTTNARFIVENEYYIDVTKSEEVATGVEVIPLQIYIHAGWAGLIAINVFLFGLWFIVRRLKYSYIYLATLVFILIMGIGGFASPTRFIGAPLLAMAFAMVILANREELQLQK